MDFVDAETACGILNLKPKELSAAVSDGVLREIRLGNRLRYPISDIEHLHGLFGIDAEESDDTNTEVNEDDAKN
jgi:hypothetical protein